MSFVVKILGSNSAIPTIKRFASAHVLNVHERFFLIDCSEGTQIRLRMEGVKFLHINHIFISHLHGDHFFGLFGLISTLSMLGRKQALNIFADERLRAILDTVLNTNEIGFQVIVNPLNFKESNVILDTNALTVTSFPLKHRIPACGFLFKEKPKQRNIRKEFITTYNLSVKAILDIKNGADYRLSNGEIIPNSVLTVVPKPPVSYAYCSDTQYYEKIIPIIKGVDLLYHEATFTSKDEKLAKATGHSTGEQAAKIAKAAEVGKLIIGHFSSRYKNNDGMEAEAKKIFPNTQALKDGDTFVLNSQ